MKRTQSRITSARPQVQHMRESISLAQFPPTPQPATSRDFYSPCRRDSPRLPERRQESYQLTIADIMQHDERHRVQWADAGPPRTTPSSSTMTPEAADANWSSAQSDGGRSDRSSSLEDVIPPAIWRVGRPAARHPTTSTIALSSRRHISMSHVGPPTSHLPPAFWGVVKHPLPKAPPAASTTPPPRRRTRATAPPTRGVRGNITARQDPAWQAAMATTGKGISVTMGLYLDGEITVNGHYAATVLREPACARCRAAGRECRVVDAARERNLGSGICSYCIRQRRKCSS